MERRIGLQLIGLGALVMTTGAQSPPPPPRPPDFAASGPTRISSGRPLSDAAELLLHLYAKVVTYEEPVLTWSGDLQPHNRLDPALKWAVEATPHTFTMPAETGAEPNLAILLDRTLQAYHQQTTGTRFQVLTSALGYHIVPLQVHDDRGQLVPASSPLDTRISVPFEERTPLGHVRALLTAIANAGGPRVEPGITDGRGFNRVFRSDPASFQWGVSAVLARDALVDLLQRSATTMRWRLWCQPSAKAEDRFCALNLSPPEFTTTDAQGRLVNQVPRFDRCTHNCPPQYQVVAPQPLKRPNR